MKKKLRQLALPFKAEPKRKLKIHYGSTTYEMFEDDDGTTRFCGITSENHSTEWRSVDCKRCLTYGKKE